MLLLFHTLHHQFFGCHGRVNDDLSTTSLLFYRTLSLKPFYALSRCLKRIVRGSIQQHIFLFQAILLPLFVDLVSDVVCFAEGFAAQDRFFVGYHKRREVSTTHLAPFEHGAREPTLVHFHQLHKIFQSKLLSRHHLLILRAQIRNSQQI